MKIPTFIAILFIASHAVSTGANAEEVYRCGSTYSQKPCPDAVVVDVQDGRTPAQKAEADAKTRHETAQVNAIEKARQREEAQRRADNAKLAALEHKKSASKPKKAASSPDTADASATKSKSKKSASKKLKKEPEVFIASAPTDKTKPAPHAGKGK